MNLLTARAADPRRGAPIVMVLAAVTAASMGAGLARAQEAPALPEVVKEWLERDQFPRWRNLIETGQKLYAEGSCSRCHGEAGGEGRFAPDLSDAEWVQSDGSLEGIFETIFWGVRRRDFADPSRRFQMNPSGGMELEWDEVRALAAYIWSLSNDSGIPRR